MIAAVFKNPHAKILGVSLSSDRISHKSTQDQDIREAKEYWAEYRSRKNDTYPPPREPDNTPNGELSG